MKKEILHTTRISIPEKDRMQLIGILNTSLASLTDLYAQIKHAHWNVKGMEFIGLHKLFDEIAEQTEEQIDIVAERITSLGGTALGTIQETAQNTKLRLYPVDIFAAKDHIEHLAHNFAILGELFRTNIDTAEELGDMVTNDIYVEITGALDKNLWFIEAHVQK
ncbi:DNA starvation/stationary phase protection protein Dps [Candidatus Dependentiae bacterium HGW-Dependentiae-1]|nr:MAG: DNA starvation/stationary phase protection protein Dps [Candidatus Dependentiae bacterium HGW-Dependentiae-1]